MGWVHMRLAENRRNIWGIGTVIETRKNQSQLRQPKGGGGEALRLLHGYYVAKEVGRHFNSAKFSSWIEYAISRQGDGNWNAQR